MSHKVSSCEVMVVGGGVIGAACARAAALRGLRVALCEPGPDRAAASPASAGMLAAQIEPADESTRGLAVRGRDLYESLAPALRETTGLDIGFWREGIASVAFDDAAADRLRDDVAQQRQAGLRCDWLEADEVAERFPGAAPPPTAAGPCSRRRTAPWIHQRSPAPCWQMPAAWASRFSRNGSYES